MTQMMDRSGGCCGGCTRRSSSSSCCWWRSSAAFRAAADGLLAAAGAVRGLRRPLPGSQTFSTVSILAVIILTGMVMTIAILLIDLMMRFRERGRAARRGGRHAGPRLRPILMTSMITIIVLIPVAFFPRTGMDAYAPLATVVIGGLIIGTLLALFVVPVLHTYTDDLATLIQRAIAKLRRREGKKEAAA